jgi:hypothetical protein
VLHDGKQFYREVHLEPLRAALPGARIGRWNWHFGIGRSVWVLKC